MSNKYKIEDSDEMDFVIFTFVEWIKVELMSIWQGK
jgi:hypothetical protein